MHLCSTTLSNWKTTIKTVVVILNLFITAFILPRFAEARDNHIRSSEGVLYSLRLDKNYGVKDFSVQSSNDDMLQGITEFKRDIAADQDPASKPPPDFPDLVPSVPTVSRNSLAPGASFTLETTVENRGTSDSQDTTLWWYRSPDPSISSNDMEVGSASVSSLEAEATATHQLTLNAPFAAGLYYYGVGVESVPGESNTANNFSTAVAIRVENPAPIAAGMIPEVPVPDVPEETWMPDANLHAAVRNALSLSPNDALTQQAMLALTNLRYVGTDLSDNQKITDLTGLEYALNLEHLNLKRHLISDLLPLERLPKLRSLWLGKNKIANIRPLTSLPLEELGLGGNPIVDFTPLTELTNLTRLSLWGNGLSNNDLHHITGLTQLTKLDLRYNQISDITSLTKLVNLKKLQLERNPISDTAPLHELLNRNPNLEIDIEISDEPPSQPDEEVVDTSDLPERDLIPDTALREVVSTTLGLNGVITRGEMQRLTTLTSHDHGIKDLTGLEHATNLTKLELRTNEITDITPLENLTNLTELWLGWNQIADITPLKNLTNLTHLGLSQNHQIVDLTPLENLTNLTELFLLENQIVDLMPLENLTNLTVLVLSWNRIADITPLKNLTNLTRLLLPGNQIVDLTPLENLTNLTVLELSRNPTPDLTPLENLTNLTYLSLRANEIVDITPLENLTNLTHLWLGTDSLNVRLLSLRANRIVDITPLKNLTNLTRLGLENNRIRDLTPLKNLTNLTELRLVENRIVNLIPLKNLKHLTELWLVKNRIVDITPLKNLINLTKLGLDRNPIHDFTPLENLTNLTHLQVNETSKENRDWLMSLQERNPHLEIYILSHVGAAPAAPVLPDKTVLLPNYPNPFNPETWIPYQLAVAADVTLTIYDVRGVVVRELALGHQPAGFYQSRGRAAHWDGRNQLGEKVASGLYFYTFTAGDSTKTGKMLIRK